MSVQTLDCIGLKCPQPSLKVTIMAPKMKPGDVLEVVANCPTFEKDIREWCVRAKKTLLWVRHEGDATRVQVRF